MTDGDLGACGGAILGERGGVGCDTLGLADGTRPSRRNVIGWTVATFHDDAAWLDRLTTMIKITFPILLATSLGCASEVELPLDPDRGAEPPPDMEPDPDPDPDPPDSPEPPPDPPPPLPDPDNLWSRTEFQVQGDIQDLVWTTDGAVVAATPLTSDLDAPEWSPMTLTRHGADGAIEWVAYTEFNDVFKELAAIEGGGVVAGIWPDATSFDPLPAGLAWYDAAGNLTASWRPSAEETGEQLTSISSFRPLPDGGVFWVGLAGIFTRAPVAGLLDAQRQLQWIVPLPLSADTRITGPADAALTADGGFAVLASSEPVTDGDEDSLPPEAFVVQLGPDGAERWRTQLVGVHQGTGIRVASSGNLIVTGTFRERMSVGELVLETELLSTRHFVAEIDPSGEARGLHAIEFPARVADGGYFNLNAMTVAGEDLVITGGMIHESVLDGLVATTHRLDGTLVSETTFARQGVQGLDGYTTSMVVDVGPDGLLAVGGVYGGLVDFGDVVVDSGVNQDGVSLGIPFITVFEKSEPNVD